MEPNTAPESEMQSGAGLPPVVSPVQDVVSGDAARPPSPTGGALAATSSPAEPAASSLGRTFTFEKPSFTGRLNKLTLRPQHGQSLTTAWSTVPASQVKD